MDTKESMADAKKPRRAMNFTNSERDLLHLLVNRYKSVILSKKNDTDFSHLKHLAWKRLTREFNVGSSENFTRTAQQLRVFLKNFHRKVTMGPPQVGELEKVKALLLNDEKYGGIDADSDTDVPDRYPGALKRSRNFTTHEKQLLTRLMQPYRRVLMNPKGTAQVNREKSNAWARVTNVFNKVNKVPRSTENLQRCWKQIKAIKRKALQKNLQTEAALAMDFESGDEFATESVSFNDHNSDQEIQEYGDNKPRDEQKYASYSTDPTTERTTGRDRQPNFTRQERRLLCNLTERYKSVILANNNNAEFQQLKRAAWERVTREFNNATLENVPRSMDSLRTLLKNIKNKGAGFKPPEKNELVRTKQLLMRDMLSGNVDDLGEDDGKIGTANFSAQERKSLIGLMRPHKVILMNPSNLKQVRRAKSVAWMQIKNQFNELCKTHRTSEELQTLWKSLRKLFGTRLNPELTIKPNYSKNVQLNPYYNSDSMSSDQMNLILTAESLASADDLPNITPFVQTQFGANPVQDAPISVEQLVGHSPVLFHRYEQMIEAKIHWHRAHLNIMRENAQMRRVREQEEFDFRMTFDEQLFSLKREQEEEIHQILLANLRGELEQLEGEGV